MTATLWHIELSHFNEKARWALDHKGIEHERKAPLPGAHNLYAGFLTRGRQRRLPVLRIDGTTIGDSTAIIAALEARQPDPPLYPADPAERARALALEDYFDEQLGPAVRSFGWYHLLNERGGIGRAIATTSPGRRRLFNAVEPVARVIIRGDYGATGERAETARTAILAAADRVEAELQPSGYLVGGAFSVADLAGAALFTPLLNPPGRPYLPDEVPSGTSELRAELAARPAGAWVFEMYARHRGTSAEVGG